MSHQLSEAFIEAVRAPTRSDGSRVGSLMSRARARGTAPDSGDSARFREYLVTPPLVPALGLIKTLALVSQVLDRRHAKGGRSHEP